jgi:hypothetical protein
MGILITIIVSSSRIAKQRTLIVKEKCRWDDCVSVHGGKVTGWGLSFVIHECP